jgi:metal-responsive CopG/Arc/MetJ family transcriptional regulator
MWRIIMEVSTINISVQNDVLFQIDQIANNEARTRVELINEAVKMYVERKNEWQKIFEIGGKIGSGLEISAENVMEEIKAYRKEKIK